MGREQSTTDSDSVRNAITAGSIRALAYYITLNYLLPLGLPIVTGYIGYLQRQPWMHIIVAAGLVFASITTGLVRFDEWIDRRRVEDKLHFVGINFGRNAHGPGIFLGVRLQNNAAIPIAVEFRSVRTRLNNTVPSDAKFDVTKFKVLPGNFVWLNDHIINTSPPTSGALEGFVEYEIQYGRIDAPKHQLSIKKQVVARFNENQMLEGGSWSDAA